MRHLPPRVCAYVVCACVIGLVVLLGATACASTPRGRPAFTVVEASIPEMQRALEEGRTTSRQLVEAYLMRIALYEETLNATMAVNPRALEVADSLDRERAAGRVRGPLHGIPIALKDNIHTTDLPTTGGALAFDGFVPPYDATLTRNLRDAGAIILAKTVMTELANYIADGMPGNYSALGGFGMNPYDPRRDPRPDFDDGRPVLGTGGSSSGIGTAASLWAANVGTETSGSILSPANANMLVGIKPTVGRVSRWGVIPITADQDTPGPMARTVTDAAILLGVLEGSGADSNDPATTTCTPPPGSDYTPFLRADGLRGARIGIPRANYYEPILLPGESARRGGLPPERQAVMSEVIAILRREGATVVDPADVPSVVDPDPSENLLLAGGGSTVLSYGMKRDFNAWLATLGTGAPVRTLTELREWNLAHTRAGSLAYGQAVLDRADARSLDGTDRERYLADRASDLHLTAEHGIDEVITALDLDALLFPAVAGANLSARPGYPTVAVPYTRVRAAPDPAFPSGFEPEPAPMGVSFAGRACSEPRLIEIAYAFEQATRGRVPPPFAP
ncbi:MAG: amidase family protein [Gemmatimonadales bacterium]